MISTTVDRLCKDCRHMRPCRATGVTSPWHAECAHPSSTVEVMDPVMGIRVFGTLRCQGARLVEGEQCGPSGRFWEPLGEVGFG